VEHTKAEIAFVERLENAIQDFRRLLRKRLVKQLMIGTNDLLARFHDGDNDSIVKIDEELNIAVELHGREVPIVNLSGAAKGILKKGDKVLIGIAVMTIVRGFSKAI